MFRIVRKYVWTTGYKRIEIIKTNPKEKDVSAAFDIETEQTVISYCKRNNLAVHILSEESGLVKLSSSPDWTLIVDPVDGSTNLKKGIEGSTFNVAVLPGEIKHIRTTDVGFAIIGSLISGGYCLAKKGMGTIYNGPFSGFVPKKVFTSANPSLQNSCIEFDLDFALNESINRLDLLEGRKIERILPFLHPERKIKHLRRNGSAGMGLMATATGAVDAYIDARDISTPENWLGAYLLITEAGGIFTGLNGNSIIEVESLVTPYSYVASGNAILHQQILNCVRL